jgi:hypothetical protein
MIPPPLSPKQVLSIRNAARLNIAFSLCVSLLALTQKLTVRTSIFTPKSTPVTTHLIPLHSTYPQTNLSSYPLPVYEAARLATLLCINHTFRHFNTHTTISQALLSQLTKIIAQIYELQILCHTTSFSRQQMEMMLWIGFVAGIFAGVEEKNWFGQ